MFSIAKKGILNLFEVLHIPQNDLGKGPLPLHLEMLTMQISTQTDNHKYRKSVEVKEYTL